MSEKPFAAAAPVSPLRVFLLVLVVVFLAEAGVMLLLPLLLQANVDERLEAVVDACLLTVISAPILWYVIIKPLRRWEREALRAENLSAIAQLATGMAHEVRNPLTAIKLLVQNYLQSVEAPALKEDLHIIEDEVRRMESTLNVFIDFARPRQMKREPLELASVVDKTLLLLEGRFAKQGVQVEFERASEQIDVYADAEQLRQILLNLCLNALDMMPQGGKLNIQIEHPPGAMARLHVRDTGPGIEKQHMSRLFEPFFTTRETGVGLGLVISQRIARDHGGDLVAKNRTTNGACFTLSIPIMKSARIA